VIVGGHVGSFTPVIGGETSNENEIFESANRLISWRRVVNHEDLPVYSLCVWNCDAFARQWLLGIICDCNVQLMFPSICQSVALSRFSHRNLTAFVCLSVCLFVCLAGWLAVRPSASFSVLLMLVPFSRCLHIASGFVCLFIVRLLSCTMLVHIDTWLLALYRRCCLDRSVHKTQQWPLYPCPCAASSV